MKRKGGELGEERRGAGKARKAVVVSTTRFRPWSQQHVSDPGLNNTFQTLVSTTRFRPWSQQHISDPGLNNTMVSTTRFRPWSQQHVSDPGLNNTFQTLVSTTHFRLWSQQYISDPVLVSPTPLRLTWAARALTASWLHLVNAELSPKKYWRGSISQEMGGGGIPNATLSPPE